MKISFVAALILLPKLLFADLSTEDPQELCSLLDGFGLEMTKYAQIADGAGPLCFEKGQITSVTDDGFEYAYRVIAHHTYDHPDSLIIQLDGWASKALNQTPHRQFRDMASIIVSRLFSTETTNEILLAIDGISPGYNRHAVLEGMNIQLSCPHPYTPDGFQLRLSIGNACHFSENNKLQNECISRSRKGDSFVD